VYRGELPLLCSWLGLQLKIGFDWQLVYSKDRVFRLSRIIWLCFSSSSESRIPIRFCSSVSRKIHKQRKSPFLTDHSAVYGAVLIPCTASGFFIQDYFGRRTLLIWGGAAMGAAMFGLAGIVASAPGGVVSGAKSNGCIAFSK
jgi:hypothetical protein